MSVVGKHTYHSKLSKFQLRPTKVSLQAYNGESITFLEEIQVPIVYSDQSLTWLLLLVVPLYHFITESCTRLYHACSSMAERGLGLWRWATKWSWSEYGFVKAWHWHAPGAHGRVGVGLVQFLLVHSLILSSSNKTRNKGIIAQSCIQSWTDYTIPSFEGVSFLKPAVFGRN